MAVYAVDFETYYEKKKYSLVEMGTEGYLYDERFDPYLVAVYGDGIDFVGHPRDFDWHSLTGHICVAHNARFDEAVFDRCKEIGLIPESCKPSEWVCTADMSVYFKAPRNLAGASLALLDRPMNKTVRDAMSGKTYKDIVAEGWLNELLKYGSTDAVNCLDIYTAYIDKWPVAEREVSRINRDMSRRGIHIDRPLLENYLEILKRKLWSIERDIPWEWAAGKSPLSLLALRNQCREEGIPAPASMAKDAPEYLEWVEEYGATHKFVAASSAWRSTNTLIKRVETVLERSRNDIFTYSLKYFGAHTGRFSGDGGFNMQNMPRDDAAGIDLRAAFTARPGHKLLLADLSQIEARVTLHLAKDTAALAKIAEGYGVYEVHAIQTMGWDPANGNLKQSENPEHKSLYQLAKARVLALGFGCGFKRFVGMAKTLAGVIISEEESEDIVINFRLSNPKITTLWASLQHTFQNSVRDDCVFELPSGRLLTYHDVKVQNVKVDYKDVIGDTTIIKTRIESQYTATTELGHKAPRVKFYGGKLTENVVQATARDVFALECMRAVHSAGYNILFHVHDELVIEVPEDTAEKAALEVTELMKQTPPWLKGCPIDVDVKIVDRYQK